VHGLAQVFANGWSITWHKCRTTLLEAPTGTWFLYYKVKTEIVHTLPLGEYGVSKKWVVIMDLFAQAIVDAFSEDNDVQGKAMGHFITVAEQDFIYFYHSHFIYLFIFIHLFIYLFDFVLWFLFFGYYIHLFILIIFILFRTVLVYT